MRKWRPDGSKDDSGDTRAGAVLQNGFVLGCETGGRHRSGDGSRDLLGAVRARLRPYILLTRPPRPCDGAAPPAALDAPVLLHRADNFLYEAVVQQGQMLRLRVSAQPKIDRFYMARSAFAPAAWVVTRTAAARVASARGRREGRGTDAVRRRRSLPVRLAGRICQRRSQTPSIDPQRAVQLSRRDRRLFGSGADDVGREADNPFTVS